MDEQRLIDANKVLQSAIPVRGEYDDSEIFYAVPTGYIKGSPTIDPLRHGYVLSSVHEQVQWERDIAIDQLHSYGVEFGEKAEIQRVRHGKWLLKAYKEPVNYRWNVKAECSECCDDEKEIWAGFFPNVPDCIARDVAIQYAEEVKMSNYCPNCGAKMDKE